MSYIFGPRYADAYDWLYSDKNYRAECALIRRLFDRYSGDPVHSVLDLGCGSGNHALPLTQAGLRVTGIDFSEAMLSNARRKAAELQVGDRTSFVRGDIRNCRLHEIFDAALMMFAVLGYQVETSDVLAALRIVREHLRSGGLLLFDFWYGPAVLHQLPTDRSKTVETGDGRITRTTASQLDIPSQTCRVDFHVRRERGGQAPEEFTEGHTIRFFFPKEIEFLLELANFKLLRLGSFPDFENEPDVTTWNVLGVAVAQ